MSFTVLTDKKSFVKALQKLLPDIKSEDLDTGGSGVRAQAVDRSGKLIDDFVIDNNGRIINVLNAPSPARNIIFIYRRNYFKRNIEESVIKISIQIHEKSELRIPGFVNGIKNNKKTIYKLPVFAGQICEDYNKNKIKLF